MRPQPEHMAACDTSACRNRQCGPPDHQFVQVVHKGSGSVPFLQQAASNKEHSSPYMIMSGCQGWQRIPKKLPGAQLWSCIGKLALLNLSMATFQCNPS